MKTVGVLFVVISALMFVSEKNRARDKRLLVLSELYRLTDHMKSEISCYLRPVCDIIMSFDSELLIRLGFIDNFKKHGGLFAYRELMHIVKASDDEKRISERFFSQLGRGYRDEELTRIEDFRAELSSIIRAEQVRLPKDKKLSATLSCAAALAVIILLL